MQREVKDTRFAGMSLKQKEQYRSYVLNKLDETLVEQVDENGKIFLDKKLQPQCKLIRVTKLDDQKNIREIVARHPYKKTDDSKTK